MTTSIGIEGLFASTYDNLADQVAFDSNSPFYKPDPSQIVAEPPLNQDLMNFYLSRDISYGVNNIKVPLLRKLEKEDLLECLFNLHEDINRQHMDDALKTIHVRCSDTILERLLSVTIMQLALNERPNDKARVIDMCFN